MDELKKIIEAIGRTFEEFKADNDKRIKAVESKGYAPADTVEKVERINAELDKMTAIKAQLEALETKVARGEFQGRAQSSF
jgi:BMFP domain-containing protein YqiC